MNECAHGIINNHNGIVLSIYVRTTSQTSGQYCVARSTREKSRQPNSNNETGRLDCLPSGSGGGSKDRRSGQFIPKHKFYAIDTK